jgi:DNA mismatch repair ATPase MutS
VRSSLLQPSCDLPTITGRLDAVSELLERAESLQDARKILPSFKDTDRLTRHFMQKPTQSGCARAKAAITAVLQLKAVLRTAPLLAAALTANGHEPPTNDVLRAIVDNCTAPELCAAAQPALARAARRA